MRYTIVYGREVQAAPSEALKIELRQEFDENTPWEEAYRMVRDFVEKRIESELKRR